MQKKLLIMIALPLVVAGVLGWFITNPSPATAQSAPSYGAYQFSTGYYSGVPSTVAEELLPAPGALYRWVITGANGQIMVAEAAIELNVLDHSGSVPATGVTISTGGADIVSTVVCDFAPIIAGSSFYHDFGEGIACAVNSAVLLEGITTTSDVWISLTAYKEKIPE